MTPGGLITYTHYQVDGEHFCEARREHHDTPVGIGDDELEALEALLRAERRTAVGK